jgi:hypothetical protein
MAGRVDPPDERRATLPPKLAPLAAEEAILPRGLGCEDEADVPILVALQYRFSTSGRECFVCERREQEPGQL